MNRPTKPKQNNIKWTDKDAQDLITLWNKKIVMSEIAYTLGKTPSAISSFISRNKKWLGIEPRPFNFGGTPKKPLEERLRVTTLDKEWAGSVPFGHWTITKSWTNSERI
jgi:hypothetical protein